MNSGHENRSADGRRAVAPTGQSAYEALADLGVHYGSSMAEIHRAGLAAQRAGTLSHERAAAWAHLRNADKRLVDDFLSAETSAAVFEDVDAARRGSERRDERRPPVPDALPADVVMAAAPVPEIDAAAPFAKDEPEPPVRADLWSLLRETWEAGPAALPDCPEPQSFLSEE